MKVKLKRDWFTPEGTLVLARNTPTEFPDEWEPVLPKDAVILDKKEEAAPPAKTEPLKTEPPKK